MLINLQKNKDGGPGFTLSNLQNKSKMQDQILRLSICKKIKDEGPDFTLINLQKIKVGGPDLKLISLQEDQR